LAAAFRVEDGFAFRRQLVIGPFIADFACTKVRLVVELDGSSHDTRGRHDPRRDRRLEELGLRVLRIDEKFVFADIDAVVQHTAATAAALQPR
jgi:very-short-patch-repair endonuclease